MKTLLAAGVLAIAASTPLALAETAPARMLTAGEAPLWRAVARINIAGNRSCSGVMISASEVLTAAHCLFHIVTKQLADPKDIKVLPGLDGMDSYAAIASVRALAVLPGYRPVAGIHADPSQIGRDIALLELTAPVPAEAVTPLPVADWPGGGTVDLLGYGRDRPWKVTLRAGCPAGPATDGLVELSCAAVPGLSGAPAVLTGPEGRFVVAVVSTQIVGPGQNVLESDRTIVVPVAPHLAELRAALR